MTEETTNESAVSGLDIFLSFIWPGLGQLHQRRFRSATMFIGASLVFTAIALLFARWSIAAWTAVAVLAVWSMYDVYRSRPQTEYDKS
jgi:hypothetical protein